MSVYYYKHGEHPAGFVGFRVATSVGGKYRQRYFSLNRYEYHEAKRLAYELDRKWKKDIEFEQHKKAVSPVAKRRVSNAIADGFLLQVIRVKKFREGRWKRHYSFYFSVSTKGYKCSRARIGFSKQQSYYQARRRAFEAYCKLRGLSPLEAKVLKRYLPTKKRAVEILYEIAKKRGYEIDRAYIQGRIE